MHVHTFTLQIMCGLVSAQADVFKQRALTCGPYRGVLGLLGQVPLFDCMIFMILGQYVRTRERLRCVSKRVRAAKVPVFPQVPFSSTSVDLEQERREQWNGCSQSFHNLRERERPSMLWEFPQNLKTLLSDLKSHMPATRSHLRELKPSSKTLHT